MYRSFVLICSILVCSACVPSIGDPCGSAVDCSVNGDRLCDGASPGGLCTIFDCEGDTCPDDAVCVRFRPEPARLSLSACMPPCSEDGDCRSSEGYRCRTQAQVEEEGLAEVLDQVGGDHSFCMAD